MEPKGNALAWLRARLALERSQITAPPARDALDGAGLLELSTDPADQLANTEIPMLP